MADAFRGLTIRLGADARPLNSAINSITKSAGQAQQQMNALNKALRFNPNNVKAIGAMVDLAGDKAVLSARKVQTLKNAMSQAKAESRQMFAGTAFAGKDIEKLASGMTDVYSKTQRARSETTHLTAELQHVYDALKRAAKVDMGISAEKAGKYVSGLQRNLSLGGAAAERAEKKIAELFDKVRSGDAVFETFGLAAGDIDKLKDKFYGLRAEFSAADKNLKALNKIEGFRAIQNQVIVFKSELREAAAEAARLKSQFYALGGSEKLGEAARSAKMLDNALEQSVQAAEEMKAAFKMLPTSVEAARIKAHAMADAEDTIKQKLEGVKALLREIEKTPGFDKVAASSRNAWADVEKLENRHAELGYQLRENKSEMEALAAASRELIRQKPDGYKKSLKAIGEELRTLKSREREVLTETKAVEGQMKTANLSKTWAEGRIELTKYMAKLKELDFQKSIMSKLGGIGQSFRQFGYGMYASITPAIMMAGRYAIQAARDTDAAYRDMRKTVNGSEKDFEALKNDAIEFSRTHITTAEQLLEIEAIGGQLGITVDNLRDFAHTVSNLDIATNMDSEEIATDLGKMASVMDINVDEYDNFGDSLVRLGNNFPAMESDIMTITTRFMGMGKVVGMSADQMLAWSTAVTSTGQKPYAGGSSMQRFINDVNLAVAEGNDKMELFAKTAGMTGEEFKQSFSQDASGTLYKVVQGLGDMQKNGENVGVRLDDLGVKTVQYRQLLLGLANQMANGTHESNLLADALRMSGEAYKGTYSITSDGKIEEAGDAMREAEKKSEGFSGTLGKMSNEAKALGMELAEGTVPFLNDMRTMFHDAAEQVHGFDDGTKQMVAGIAGVAAASGPVTVGLGTLISSVGEINKMFSSGSGKLTEWAAKLNPAGEGAKKTSKAAQGLGKALGFLSTTKGLLAGAGIAVAIGVVADAFKKAEEKANNYRDAIEGMANLSKDHAVKLRQASKEVDDNGNAMKINALSVDELAEKNGSLTRSIAEKNDAAADEINRLNSAYSVINKYLGKTVEGASAQGQLYSAVQTVNDICGTQYSVLDASKGKLADENGQILQNIDSLKDYVEQKRIAIQQEALSAAISSAMEAESEALKTYTEERKKLQEMEETYPLGSLTPEQGEQWAEQKTKVEDAKAMYDSAHQSVEKFTTDLGEQAAASQKTAKTISDLVDQNYNLKSLFATTDDANRFKSELENFGMTAEEFKGINDLTWSDIIGQWSTGKQTLAEILSGMGMSARTAAESFSAEMGKTKDGGDKFALMCDNLKVKQDDFANNLVNVGINAQQMSALGSAAFQALYNSSGQNLDLVKYKIDAINQANIDPKNLTVTDNGQIANKKGELIDFNNFKIGDKVFKVDETGIHEVKQKTEELKASADEADGAEVNVDAKVTGAEQSEAQLEDLSAKADALEGEGVDIPVQADNAEAMAKLSEINGFEFKPKKITVSATTDSAVSAIGRVEGALRKVKDKKVGVSAVVSGKGTVDALAVAISQLHDKEITVTVHKKEDKQATGGVNMAQLYPVRAFATGGAINGIVRKAMVTSQGLIGEAGTEAVLNMGRSAAVVPLSNRRYVRPFARAVAKEMGGGGQTVQSTTMNVYLDGNFVAGGVSESTTLGELASGLRRKARA